jgi:hypothetical protein
VHGRASKIRDFVWCQKTFAIAFIRGHLRHLRIRSPFSSRIFLRMTQMAADFIGDRQQLRAPSSEFPDGGCEGARRKRRRFGEPFLVVAAAKKVWALRERQYFATRAGRSGAGDFQRVLAAAGAPVAGWG